MRKAIFLLLLLLCIFSLPCWANGGSRESEIPRRDEIMSPLHPFPFDLSSQGRILSADSDPESDIRLNGGDNLDPMQEDSLNVRCVGRWPFGPAYAVAVDSTRQITFLGSGGGIYILDTTDPANPVKLSQIATPGIVKALFYKSDHLYVADGEKGLRMISVYTPSIPVEVGYCDALGEAEDVVVSGSYAYVAGDEAGLLVISVSDPSNPVEVGSCDSPGSAIGIAVSGSYALHRR